MRAIEATLIVPPDRKAVLQLPEDVAPGEHHVFLVIEGATRDGAPGTRPPLVWGRHDVRPVNPNETFRREDMYGDDGR